MGTAPTDHTTETIAKWLDCGSINIFGMQLSGKDTQAELLAEIFDGTVVGGGDILRNSIIPERSQLALAKGDLVPTEDYISIVLPYLSKSEFTGKPLFLSAVGRWLGEEQNVLAATKAARHPIKAVLYLTLEKKVALERLALAQRRRDDDHPENVVRRIEEFENKTLPVLDVYRSMGLLIEVDGHQKPEAVLQDILDRLYERARRS